MCGLRPKGGLIRGDELRGCWRPLTIAGHNGRAVEPRIDPLGPAFPFPGSIWATEAEA